MEIYNSLININSLKKEKNINFKNKTVPIQQITETGLKVASTAIAAIGLGGILSNIQNNNEDYETRRNRVTNEISQLWLQGKIDNDTKGYVQRFTSNENIHLVQYILNCPDNEKLMRNFRDFVMRARKTEQANFAILALEKIKENLNNEENYLNISYAAEKVNNENYEFSLKLLENFKDFRVVSDILRHSDEKTIPYLQEIIKNPYSNQFEQLFKKDSYGLLTDSSVKLEILQSLKNQSNYNDSDISEIISSVKFENHLIAQLLINKKPDISSERFKNILSNFSTEIESGYSTISLNNLYKIVFDTYSKRLRYSVEDLIELSQIAQSYEKKEEIEYFDEKLGRGYYTVQELKEHAIKSKNFDKDFEEEVIRLTNGENRVISPENFANFINHVTPENKDIVINILENMPKMFDNNYQLKVLLRTLKDTKKPATFEKINVFLDDKENNFPEAHSLFTYFIHIDNSNIANLDIESFKELYEKVQDLRKLTMKNANLYINGEENPQGQIDDFFNSSNFFNLMTFIEIFQDDAIINDLLRQRFSKANEFLWKLRTLTPENQSILKEIINCKDKNGKELSPLQKIQFIEVIYQYQKNEMDVSDLKDMIQKGIVNTEILNKSFFTNIISKLNIEKEEMEKITEHVLTNYDANYVHLLATQIQNLDCAERKVFLELIKADASNNFEEFINNIENDYGKANAITKEIFTEHNLNFEKWEKPSKEFERHIYLKDSNIDNYKHILRLLIEDIEKLRLSGAKKFLDSHLSEYIKDDKFTIPEEIENNKASLKKFIQTILNTLEPVWNRAEKNSKSSDSEIIIKAENTLTIKNHLEQRLKDIDEIPEIKKLRDYDLTIKMWDRNFAKDIFQGNYSSCCIGMNESNALMMPLCIAMKAYNMIEIYDNISGEVIGNALCYFANKNGEDVFIVDNIEIRNSSMPSEENCKIIREEIAKYAKNIAKDVTGQKDIKVYLGCDYNDVPIDDLKQDRSQVEFLGGLNTGYVYMDLYHGTISTNMHDPTPTELLLRANSFYALALTDEQKQELAKPKLIKRPRIKEVCEMYEL